MRVIIGARIRERRLAKGQGQPKGLSQSELARRLKLTQGTIAGLERGDSRSSTHLHRIARELDTTPAYLEGETDDPQAGAAPPAPAGPQVVMMGVVLPPERALARMFEALLAGMPAGADRDEQALLLAQRLPIGLAQLRDLLPSTVTPVSSGARTSAPVLATSEAERPA